jgi:hypothetical protein
MSWGLPLNEIDTIDNEKVERTREPRVEFFPKEQSNVIFAFSFLIGLSAIYAFYKKQYDIFLVSILIFITSLDHWRDPQYGFRRNLDIFVVSAGFVYLCIRAIIRKIKSRLFWFSFIAVILSFYISWHLYYQGHVWLSTISHCILHICGNMSVILFCSGI